MRLKWALPPLLGGAVFLVALAAILMTREAGRVAAIWPCNALLVAVVLSRPRTEWAALIAGGFIGNAAANLVSGDLPAVSLLLAFANMSEVLIVSLVAGRHGRLRVIRRSGLVQFAAAVAIGCLASTGLALLGLAVLGARPTLEGAGLWLTADSLGLLVFTPLLMELVAKRGSKAFSLSAASARELWFPLLALILVTVGTFSQSSFPILFIPVAALALLAASSGFHGGVLGVVSIGAVILIMSPGGLGPIETLDGDLQSRIVFLQLYLLVLTVLAMFVGSISSERRSIIRRQIRARSARRTGDARIRLLLNQSRLAEKMARVGYWTMDARTGEAFWSPEVYNIHGVEPGAFELTVEAALEFYTPEDRERFREAARQCRLTGEGWEIDAVIVRRSDGENRVTRCLAQAETARDGTVTSFFGVLKDLTDERQAAAAAAEQHTRYRLLADNASDVIALYGPDSIFRYVSPAITELLGYRPDELVGRSTYDFIHSDDRSDVAKAFALAAQQPGQATIEYRAYSRDGSLRWLEARPRFKRGPTGEITEIHDCVRDVSERRERELALSAARQAAEQAAEAKARFLATMSHEIRTPLHGVLGFADLLAGTPLTRAQTRHLDHIRSAGRSLASLIDDILEFSRIEAGRMPLEANAFNLKLVVGEVIEIARATAPHLSFSLDLSDTVQDWIMGDQLRVRQILTNLVGNAAKFTPSGAVRIACDQADGRLRIRVMDEGIGLAPDLQEAVFDLFVQADAAVGRRFGGAGLGLTISRSLARMMGGDVTLENRPDRGTVATLELPYAPAASPPLTPEADGGDGRRLRILVVDDVDMNLELMCLLLRPAGHDVVAAASGAAAVRMVREEGPFDLVLMDLQMPGTDGLAATRIIRELEGPVSGVPVIALSADVLPETVAACRDAGMDDHLRKPVQPAELHARIDRLAAGEPSEPFEVLRRRYRLRMAAEADELDRILAADPSGGRPAVREAAHRIAGTAGSLRFDAVTVAAMTLSEAIRQDESMQAPGVVEALRTLTASMRSA
ncbi:MAG: PAS domain S-box protein [Alphaproteobacteria bacterium]|nr:PAS domain S-box protein [Alphaproteobacteria bacterium]MBU2041888.1 PAS domain S-box protein [Alphaproteobacteria bacterium]MBU2124381.1 PAS domain S-box protein [Alphaproteobacteria bacterium]MBU2208852.1 PAS domain S-box protein [Alphaproteobacteria bacterium]MBU2292085.1 PAS domain S-box protein [Alphaproteobacteria bacterium]